MQAVTPVPQEVTMGRSKVMPATKILFGHRSIQLDSAQGHTIPGELTQCLLKCPTCGETIIKFG